MKRIDNAIYCLEYEFVHGNFGIDDASRHVPVDDKNNADTLRIINPQVSSVVFQAGNSTPFAGIRTPCSRTVCHRHSLLAVIDIDYLAG